jgi:hypothetical protein
MHPEVVRELLVMADSVRTALGDRITGQRGNTNRSPGRIRMVSDSIDHHAKGKKYEIRYEPSHRYPGGTEYALTDGYLGSLEFSDESWMGFHGDDLDLIIDLEKPIAINNIEISSLINQASWIFAPVQLEIFAGNTNSALESIFQKYLPQAEKDLKVRREVFQCNESFTARYLHIVVHNTGLCPDWHPGTGENAWLFVDEIRVN